MLETLNPTDLFWLFVLIFSLFAEAITPQLVSIWFAFGAVGAIIAARMGANGLIQIAVCLCISAVLIIATRPIAKKLVQGKPAKTNTDRIIGEKAVVIENINNERCTGKIQVMGQIWTARAIVPEMRFAEGSEVVVHEISGVKAMVRPVENEVENKE